VLRSIYIDQCEGAIRRRLASAILAALALLAAPVAADTVVSGKSAQALRCAAYIGMAAQYGYDEGHVSADDRELMTYWSVRVLERWVPLDADRQLAAYRATLAELGSRYQTYTLLARHAEWCLREFTPAL
jgi:hypothetical protein